MLAVGFTAAVVAAVLARFFKSSGKGSSGSNGGTNKDPQSDDTGSKSKWVIGGNGLSNGPAGQQVFLYIYPRDAKNHVLPIDIRRLTVSISQFGFASPIKDSEFELLDTGDGYKASYSRPPALGEYTVEIVYDLQPSVRLEYKVEVTTQESVVSAQSYLRVPDRVPVGVPASALIFPIDKHGKPRLGYDDHASFLVSFTPELPESYTLTVFNDCLSINFALPPEAAGKEYTMDVKLWNSADCIKGAPAVLSAILGVDPEKTEAFGDGLSSGLALERTEFTVRLKDQLGGRLTESELTNLKYNVSSIVSICRRTSNHLSTRFTSGWMQ